MQVGVHANAIQVAGLGIYRHYTLLIVRPNHPRGARDITVSVTCEWTLGDWD
jgi:hypothetical protein